MPESFFVRGSISSQGLVSDEIKGIESTLEENVKNLDNNVRLGKDLAQSVSELWKILEKFKNLRKWQQVTPPQSQATILQEKKSSKYISQVEENKNSDNRNQAEHSFKLVIFGNSITKLIVPHQIINCNEHETTNLSQSKARRYCPVECFKNNCKRSKVENIVIHVGTNHIQGEGPKFF